MRLRVLHEREGICCGTRARYPTSEHRDERRSRERDRSHAQSAREPRLRLRCAIRRGTSKERVHQCCRFACACRARATRCAPPQMRAHHQHASVRQLAVEQRLQLALRRMVEPAAERPDRTGVVSFEQTANIQAVSFVSGRPRSDGAALHLSDVGQQKNETPLRRHRQAVCRGRGRQVIHFRGNRPGLRGKCKRGQLYIPLWRFDLMDCFLPA
jgi:hypothetical protein